ncbi:MAG: elongation factor G [Geminicoccaceae bacterium]|nr:MAG: elongation factor G [Geminicoccaceae bacterium]
MQVATKTLNVALVGPAGTGKTTLFESLAFVAGAIPRRGSATQGFVMGDPSAEAKARSTTTEATCAHFSHGDVEITLLDTPGSVELAQEARNLLPGIDLAIIVLEPVAERVIAAAPIMHGLDALEIPHLVFFNKMDRSEQPYRDLLDALRRVSARPIVPHHYAIGRGETLVGYVDLLTEQAYAYHKGEPSTPMPLPEDYREREQQAHAELLETLADFDDDLLEAILEDKEPPTEQVLLDLQKTLGADQVVPVFIGVAEHDMGVRRLLEALEREAPRADISQARVGIEAEGSPVIQVLKTYHQAHSGKLSLVRVWRGPVKDGVSLGGNRVGGVFQLMGSEQRPVGEAVTGAIVALGRLENAHTGDTLSTGDDVPALPRPELLKPMFALAIRTKNRNDDVKLSGALAKLTEEDPSLVVEQDAELRQTLLWGQGDVHVRLGIERLAQKYKLEVDASPPETPYRETIKKAGNAHGRHKKQSGGHGQFGDVKIEIRPLPRGEGFVFDNRIVGGSVPKQYIPAVEAGAREFMAKGPLGFPVVDVGVTLVDGQFHSVDSSEMAFKTAAALALKEGLPQCGAVLLEPIVDVTVSVPSEHTSKVLQLASQKRGQILGFDAKAHWPGWDEVKLQLPQGEMSDLVIGLRSLTQGVGFFEWAPNRLEVVPDRLVDEVVAHKGAA